MLAPAPPRPDDKTFAAVGTADQWLRCAHVDTALDADVVSLARTPGAAAAGTPSAGTIPAWLAFDPGGCLYRSDPSTGQVQRIVWRPTDPLSGHRDERPPVDLFAAEPATPLGDFSPAGSPAAPSFAPTALAVDADEHLFLLDGTTGSVLVLDLGDGRLLWTVRLPVAVVDLASEGRTILLATADPDRPLYRMEARSEPREVAVPPEAFAGVEAGWVPARVAAGPGGEVWLLARTPDGRGWAVPVADARAGAAIGPFPFASDVELDGEDRLVVAGRPGEDLLRFEFEDGVVAEGKPLQAPRWTAGGLVRTPDGRIGFWTDHGFRVAVEARPRYEEHGSVDLFRLDAGVYRTQWGRIFVEACIPGGTSVRAAFVTSDDEPGETENDGPSIARTVPSNLTASIRLPRAWPPLVAASRVPELARLRPLHRRETGMDVAWARRDPDDRFEVYEAPVAAPPGRYLWVRLDLRGTRGASPRVRAARVEHPGHDWRSRLPRVYSDDPAAASFLDRYLAMPAGVLADVEERSTMRDVLLDPFGAPADVLPWLASLVGMTLDDRWPEPARRRMLSEAVCLFRRRGTIAALRRMIEIYLGCQVIVIERFRLRGLGGGLLGDESAAASSSVVGFGFRVGGGVGRATAEPIAGTVRDAFETHAHRFTLLVPCELDDEREQTTRHLLDMHRPAHTIVDLCTVGAGMRVGVGLHVELSSIVGPSAGFRQARLGASRLGRGITVGRGTGGVRPSGTRVGVDSRVDT